MKTAFSLPINIVANFFGRGMSGIIILISTPILANMVGMRGYGIIGFYNALLAIFLGFDFGLGLFLQRECTRKSEEEVLSLFRALEMLFFLLTGLLSILFFFLQPLISSYCLHGQTIADQGLTFILIGACIGLQWPTLLYAGALTGYHRLPQLNFIYTLFCLLRFVGAIALLKWVSESLLTYFLFQLLLNLIQLMAMRLFVFSLFPRMEKRAFDFSAIVKNMKFVVPLSISSFLGILFRQLDKLILIQLVSLETFGIYCLASALSYGLYSIIGPVYHAIFPKFAQLVHEKNKRALIAHYQHYSSFLSLLLLPTALFIFFFSYDILYLWTHDAQKANDAAFLLKMLTLTVAANGLVHIPGALQLAYGWTKLNLYQNLIALCATLPALLLGFHFFGITGFVSCLVCIHLFLIFFNIEVMHRKILKNQKWRWYRNSLLIPLLICMPILLIFSAILKTPLHFLEMSGVLLLLLLLCFSKQVLELKKR